VRTFLLAVITALVLAGMPASATAAVRPLPIGPDLDYQLGGAASVPANVGIVVRDRGDEPAAGRYNVCYVNAFQTQSDERRLWRSHWKLVLKRDGRPVVDSAWDEWLLDTRTRAKRTRIARIVGRWIDGCEAAGFDAVELDNLDSWSRSHRLIRPRDNKALARRLVVRAHRAGLAVAQKNWAEWDGRAVGFDFAIAEECGRWHECGAYVRHYGRRVLVVEYRAVDFDATCARWGSMLAVVLRDRELRPNGVHRWC
jgi:hypothetical protein